MAKRFQDLKLSPNVWQPQIESLLLGKSPLYYHYYHGRTLPGSQIKSKFVAASDRVSAFGKITNLLLLYTVPEHCQDLKLGPNVCQPLIESLLLGKSPFYYYYYHGQTLPGSQIRSKCLAASDRVSAFGKITTLLLLLMWPNIVRISN